ncbi:MAG: efflux RND transporter periplasmic adaptor subunit [Deltaproteobacteria bacterium]|nr:efflux RND transporter periplasmic adaptor subunit [Deltaproteobacteria bacterium]
MDAKRLTAPRAASRGAFARWWKRGALGACAVIATATVARAKLAPREVDLQPVVRGIAVDAVYATATLEARERVTVQSKIGGTITQVFVREGDAVKRGDLLATVDTTTLQYELERSRADQRAALEQASLRSPSLAALEAQAEMTRASLATARAERQRLEQLHASGSVPIAELERVAAQARSLEAQLLAQEAQARAQRVDLSARASGVTASVRALGARVADGEIRSPIDGVVLSRALGVGELAAPNAPLFRIGDDRELVLEAWVDESDMARVAKGSAARASLRAFPKSTLKGEVFEIAPDSDRARKAYLVKVRLSGLPPSARPGMSADVNLVALERTNALLVPSAAVDADGFVWLARAGRAERRHIEIGVRDLQRTEVVAGLAEGDLVAVGDDALSEGSRVRARAMR